MSDNTVSIPHHVCHQQNCKTLEKQLFETGEIPAVVVATSGPWANQVTNVRTEDQGVVNVLSLCFRASASISKDVGSSTEYGWWKFQMSQCTSTVYRQKSMSERRRFSGWSINGSKSCCWVAVASRSATCNTRLVHV